MDIYHRLCPGLNSGYYCIELFTVYSIVTKPWCSVTI